MPHPRYFLDTTYTHPANPVFNQNNNGTPYDLSDQQKALDLIYTAPGPFPYHWGKTGEGSTEEYLGLFDANSSYNDKLCNTQDQNPDNIVAMQKALFHTYGKSRKLENAVLNLNSRKVMAETRLAIGKIAQIDNPKIKESLKVGLFEQLKKDLRLKESLEKEGYYIIRYKTHQKIGQLFRTELNEPEMADILDFSKYKIVS